MEKEKISAKKENLKNQTSNANTIVDSIQPRDILTQAIDHHYPLAVVIQPTPLPAVT